MKIRRLVLYTSHLSNQIDFYKNTLGVEIISESEHSAVFKIGATLLEFVLAENTKPYHFAINIPSYKEIEALAWLKERVGILKHNGDELIDFVNWNAKSMYFYDADKNIVELIARKNLDIEAGEKFSAKQFLEISEIGMSVKDVSGTFRRLNDVDEMPLYFGNLDWFCAAGDEHGLCIIINQNKKGWMPTNDYAYTANFKLRGDVNFEFLNGKILKFIDS